MKSGLRWGGSSSSRNTRDFTDWSLLVGRCLLYLFWTLGLLASVSLFAMTQNFLFLILSFGFGLLIATESLI